jgi:uncharacterized membrane protein
MESRVKLFGHPLHQMLIVFPLGLLGAAALFDILHLVTNSGNLGLVSYYMIAGGLIGGVLAAPAGLVDWLSIPSGTRARTIGAFHGLANVVVLGLFTVSWFLRGAAPQFPSTGAMVLAFAGLALAGVSGWLGGELVSRLGVGVDDGANLNAPSSLRGSTPRP